MFADFINLNDADSFSIQELGIVEHEQFVDFMLPKLPLDLTFVDTVRQWLRYLESSVYY